MQVKKRNGNLEQVKFEKISKRLKDSSKNLNVDHVAIAQKVIEGLYDGITTSELDLLAAETAYSNSTKHPDYDKLAVKIIISRLHKDTPSTFSECVNILSNATDSNGNNKSLLDDNFVKFVKKHAATLDACINYNRDFEYDYFGYKTLERSYLLKTFIKDYNNKLVAKIIERPQHMLLRVAVAIHMGSIPDIINTYEMLSSRQFTHATPTLFNAGLIKNQLSSCFLIANKEDSISGIYDTLKEVALISQSAGGIGVHIHDVRSKGSPIFGTGGTSNGIIPMLKVYNETCRYVDQCFADNTNIETKNGLIPISNIKKGDYVKNYNQEFSEVKEVKSFDYNGQLIELVINGNVYQLTEDHPLLVVRSNNDINHIAHALNVGLIKPEWVSVKDILETDIVLGVK